MRNPKISLVNCDDFKGSMIIPVRQWRSESPTGAQISAAWQRKNNYIKENSLYFYTHYETFFINYPSQDVLEITYDFCVPSLL
jgi:hypothetical protein